MKRTTKGFHHIEILIWLIVLFFFVTLFLFSHHFKHTPTPHKESQATAQFWKQLTLKAKEENNETTSVQQIKEFQDQFFIWAQLTQDPNNPWVLLKEDGQPAKTKGMLCELRAYNPRQPFVKPVCEI